MKKLLLVTLALSLAACRTASDASEAKDVADAGTSIVDPSRFISVYECEAASIDVTHPIRTKKFRVEKENASDELLRAVWRDGSNRWIAGGWLEISESDFAPSFEAEIYQYAPGSDGNSAFGKLRITNGRGFVTLNQLGDAEELVLSNCMRSGSSRDSVAAETITIKGTLTFGASTDWNPPANHAIQNGPVFWWVDLATNGLVEEGEDLIRQNVTVLVTGVPTIRDDQPVLVATAVKRYVRRADAPTESDCRTALQSFSRYMPPANSYGMTEAEGECAISITFEDEQGHAQYKTMRRNEGLSSDWHVMTRQGRTIRIAIVQRVIGGIVIQPVAGVSN